MTWSKTEIRKRMRAAWKDLSESEKRKRETVLCQSLIGEDALESCGAIGLYLAMPDEVELETYLRYLFARGKRVAVPVFQLEQEAYEYRWITAETEIQTGAFGVREPIGAEPAHRDELDAVLIPGRSFDYTGNRIGRGKGHIDQLLAGYAGLCVGICFAFQVADESDVFWAEPHDVPMQLLVTENAVLRL